MLDALLKELKATQNKKGRIILLDILSSIVEEFIGVPLSSPIVTPSRDITAFIPVWDEIWSLITPSSEIADWQMV